jgi:hypothetical protein
MSLHQALVNATEGVLAEYLAPELASKLTREITLRVRADLEEALQTFVGFDLSRPVSVRPKAGGRVPAPVAKAVPGKGKKSRQTAAAPEPAEVGGGDSDEGAAKPLAESPQMSMAEAMARAPGESQTEALGEPRERPSANSAEQLS